MISGPPRGPLTGPPRGPVALRNQMSSIRDIILFRYALSLTKDVIQQLPSGDLT